MIRLLSTLALLTVTAFCPAGEFNKVLSPGDPTPTFEKLKGTDDKEHTLADYNAKPIMVLVFTCNTCPVANDYEGRIAAAVKAYATGDNAKVAVVAIDSNSGPDDSLAKMKERATKKKYMYPYLSDPSGAVAKAYGATKTPEVFVLNKDRKVVYMGAMDDKNKADDAKVNFLHAAIDAAILGKTPATQETLGRGCKIKFAEK